MKLKTYLALVLATLLFSCASDDDSSKNQLLILGDWQLREVRSGFGPGSAFYNTNEVIYSFGSNGNLEVASTSPDFSNSTNTYEVTDDCFVEGCPSGATVFSPVLIINDSERHVLMINGDSMIFGTNFIDGTDYVFERL